MMDVQPYKLPEVIDREALREWQNSLPPVDDRLVPKEVRDFIDALAAKLPDFGCIRRETKLYTGYELMLAGMKDFAGEKIELWQSYPVEVPYLMAINNRHTMLRLFKKKGKQGLIDYCRARVKGSELERLLYVLNVHVFHEDRPEYRAIMEGIRQAKQITEV